MRLGRAEIEGVACLQNAGSVANGELQGSFDDVADFLAHMLDESVALTADLDDVKGALEKAIPAGRAQRFERNAFSASEFVRPENQTMSLSENEAFARRALFKQIRDGDTHRLCNPEIGRAPGRERGCQYV